MLINISSVVNKRVLLIDADPQGNLSTRFLDMKKNPIAPGKIPPPHEYRNDDDPNLKRLFHDKSYTSIADIFFVGYTVPYEVEDIENLDIVPVDGFALSEANEIGKEKSEETIIRSFYNFIDSAKKSGDYDIILIDTPPNKGPVTRAAIRAATDAFIVVRPEAKSIEGLSDMVEIIDKENQFKDPTQSTAIKGILINGYSYKDRTVHDRTISKLEANPGLSKYLISEKVGERVDLKLIDMEDAIPTNPFGYPKNNPVYIECMRVAQAIEKRIYDDEE